MTSGLRIGVYIDGYNLYYGGNRLVGDGRWKWLDVRALVAAHIPSFEPWDNAVIKRLVYFTAEVTNAPESLRRQQAYIEALQLSKSVDYVEFGRFRSILDENFAATGYFTRIKRIQKEEHPLPDEKWIKIDSEKYVRVTHEKNEEKRSDVNLASHLMIDLFMESIDAAIVVSNDADLTFPIKFARTRIPVGVINPRGTQTVGDLKGNVTDGVGSHWWYRITGQDLLAYQLPETIGHLYRPAVWR